MHATLLALHSLTRWAVLVFIIYSVYRAFTGLTKGRKFSKTDNALRHWTATIAHIQLMIGMILYTQSPVVKYFWSSTKSAGQNLEVAFYGLIHLTMMLAAIIVLTIGSAMAKRKRTDKEQFKTMLVFFSIALFIIFVAIPWPFSPLANRPYTRTF